MEKLRSSLKRRGAEVAHAVLRHEEDRVARADGACHGHDVRRAVEDRGRVVGDFERRGGRAGLARRGDLHEEEREEARQGRRRQHSPATSRTVELERERLAAFEICMHVHACGVWRTAACLRH